MFRRLFVPVLLAAVLFVATGCARSSGMLRPGDKVGDIVLVKATPDATRYGTYCRYPEGTPDPLTPGTYQISCEVPPSRVVWIDDGWYAVDQQTLDDNWRAFTYELYLDDRQVDLQAFGTSDSTRDDGSRGRSFNLALENASGTHTIRLIHRIKEQVFDGYDTYQAGTYETTNTVTVKSQ